MRFWPIRWREAPTCRHRWLESLENRFGVPTEQTCSRCGARRHLLTFEEIHGQNWAAARPGPHPIGEDMRAKGITRNYGRPAP